MQEKRGVELELESATKHGSGSQSGEYYKIEYRNTSSMPKVIGDGRAAFPFVIDSYWRTLHVTLGATEWGVNIPIRSWDAEPAKNGCMSYIAAEAHRWAFLAALEAGVGGPGGALCVETRLVRVKFSHNYSIEEIGVTEHAAHKYHVDVSPRKIEIP